MKYFLLLDLRKCKRYEENLTSFLSNHKDYNNRNKGGTIQLCWIHFQNWIVVKSCPKKVFKERDVYIIRAYMYSKHFCSYSFKSFENLHTTFGTTFYST